MAPQGYRGDDSAALIREHSDKAHEVRKGRGTRVRERECAFERVFEETTEGERER